MFKYKFNMIKYKLMYLGYIFTGICLPECVIMVSIFKRFFFLFSPQFIFLLLACDEVEKLMHVQVGGARERANDDSVHTASPT